jgi:Stress responsive A/B Barrel Domain
MIRHTVVFRLKHQRQSEEEADFLKAADVLIAIPGVKKFEKLRQVSSKNGYHFGFSMEFVDQAAYTRYDQHPDHVAFVQGRWIPEVEAFMEIDYVVMAQ